MEKRLEMMRAQKKALDKARAELAWNEFQIACNDAAEGLGENEIPVFANSVTAGRRVQRVYETLQAVLGLEVAS